MGSQVLYVLAWPMKLLILILALCTCKAINSRPFTQRLIVNPVNDNHDYWKPIRVKIKPVEVDLSAAAHAASNVFSKSLKEGMASYWAAEKKRKPIIYYLLG